METAESDWLTPAEMSERTGVSIDTLRYYEREQLIVGVHRASSGHRRYSAADVGWVDVLRCLRLTGMSIEQMRAFATLGQDGEHTEPERLRQLSEHRAQVERRIDELREALVVIDGKIAVYRHARARRGAPA